MIPTGLIPDSLRFEVEDLERHHGSLDVTADEVFDHARAREDQLADHCPQTALAWTASPARPAGASPVPSCLSSCEGGTGEAQPPRA